MTKLITFECHVFPLINAQNSDHISLPCLRPTCAITHRRVDQSIPLPYTRALRVSRMITLSSATMSSADVFSVFPIDSDTGLSVRSTPTKPTFSYGVHGWHVAISACYTTANSMNKSNLS